MRTLVTGGAGFIGSNLSAALLAEGAEVVVLDDLSTGHAENVPRGAELIEGDVGDVDVVTKAMAGCEVVFHHAAHRAVLRSVQHPLETNRTNITGTLTVLVSAHEAGVRRVVYASSSSVYGGAPELPTPESAPLVPRSPYAVSKLAGEQYCRVFWELFGLETVCLRYFNVYGPRQRPDSQYAAVIPLFIDGLRHGRSLEIHGDGRQSRSFTYVSDVVAANLRAAAMPAERCAGRAYNISGGKPHTLLELVGILENLLDMPANMVHTEPRAGDIRHSWAAIEAAARDLEHRPSVEFSEGLSRTLEWRDGAALETKPASTSATASGA